MRDFFVWVVKSPVRLVEFLSGVLLLLAAFLFSEGGLPSISLYGFGTLLLFLTLYAYLKQEVRPMMRGASRGRIVKYVALVVVGVTVGFSSRVRCSRRPGTWRRVSGPGDPAGGGAAARAGLAAGEVGIVNAPYPFSAIVGQEDLKLALLLNAVSPEVGGVLVRGEKGTAKSTAVRALAKLLPPIRVVAGCPFSCDPEAPNPECPAGPHPSDAPAEERPVRLVELPVGASTDRLAGTLDIEKALSEGKKAFEPGLLAAAHRGILYVDEVNLLSDHLVDLLLDVAAMGVNHVEREGVSVRHPSRFVLVGTMNPEEGELRPQLLDRFGVTVEVAGSPDPAERVEVVRRRLHHEADPSEFAAKWSGADGELAALRRGGAATAAGRAARGRDAAGDLHALRRARAWTACAATS